jgi:hypothetical protein
MCPKGIISPEKAEVMLPFILRRVALEAIDCNITLENYPTNSHAVERKIMSMTGYANLASKLAFIIWTTPKSNRKAK